MHSSPHPTHRAALICLSAAIMLSWTWLTWPDAIVDFGRELYAPWQILEGRVLYRDLGLFNGPLSPYLNAAWLAVFGVSLRALFALNALVLAATSALVYRLVRNVATPAAATTAALTLTLVFAFNNYSRIGNYNWMAPYSHELTHGIALALLDLLLLSSFLRRERARDAAAVGFVLGLVFLTKLEVFAATAAAVAAGWLLRAVSSRDATRTQARAKRPWIGFAAGLLLPPCAAFALLTLAMPPSEALLGVAGGWAHAFTPGLSALPFFQRSMGLDRPVSNLFIALGGTLHYAWLFGPAALLAWGVGRRERSRRLAIVIAVLAWSAAVWSAWPELAQVMDWSSRSGWADSLSRLFGLQKLARPWPLLLMGLLPPLLVWTLRTRAPEERTRAQMCVVAVVFALALLAKMFLNARIWHYGFALAMPAAIVLVVALVHGVPAQLHRWGGAPEIFRRFALTTWICVIAVLLGLSAKQLESKYVVLGADFDTFRCDERGGIVGEALAWIASHAGSDETLTVLPGGEMLGYLARRRSPVRFGNFTPPPMIMFGETVMLHALRAEPPDWIALVDRDTSVFGARFFGKDYALRISDWIDAAYTPVQAFGAPVFGGSGNFGILLLQRKPRPNWP